MLTRSKRRTQNRNNLIKKIVIKIVNKQNRQIKMAR